MRTTLTIDDNIMAALKQLAFESDKPLKQVVNEVLAKGLQEPQVPVRRKRFSSPSYHLGEPGLDLIKATRLAGELEDDALAAKLELRR